MNYILPSLLSALGIISYAHALDNQSPLLIRISELEKNLDEIKGELKRKSPGSSENKKSPLLIRISEVERNLEEVKGELQRRSFPSSENKETDFKYRFGGSIKADAFYDVNAKGAAFGLNAATLPLKGHDDNANNQHHFNGGISASRVFADVSKTFSNVATSAYIEFDFAKDTVDATTTTSLSPRIRHAYAKADGFLVGQTWYTFQDLSAFINTLDNLYGGSRQPMLRYTFNINKCLTLAIAAEKPNTEYISNDSSLNDNSNYGKSQLPDFATQLKFMHTNGHVAISSVFRRLQVRGPQNVTGQAYDFSKNTTGWGLGFTGRYNFYKKNGFIWQINGGQGIGRYVDDINNQAAYLQYGPGISPQFSSIKVMNYIAGVEMWLTSKLAANMAASITRISKPSTSIDVTGYNTTQQRYHTNIIYNIFPNSQIGLEIMYYQRHAGLQTTRNGKGTRILSSFIYKF